MLVSLNAVAAGRIEVIAGQELIIYQKKSVSGRSFPRSATLQAFSSGSVSQLRFLNSKVAVLGLSSEKRASKVVNEADLLAACERFKNEETGCEINHVIKAYNTPNDSFYSSLYGLRKIKADSAWDVTTGSASVKVAVVDTGVDYTHSDLSSNISVNSNEVPGNGVDDDANGFVDDYYGYDFANSDSNPMDDQSHGTHVAGTIGAIGNNDSGVVGVNWSVGIIPVKVLDSNGSGTLASVIAGINYAVTRGANIVNLSLGGSGFSQTFYDSIQNANNSGVLIVAAAGNETNNNDSSPSYPASYDLPNVISVAATSSTDGLASFSNYGASSVDLAAPGVSISSTLPGGTYGSYSGTSMATPHVAGAAALVKAANPSLTMGQIKSILLSTVDIVSGLNGKVSTGGRLNVAAAVASATGTNPPPAEPPSDGGGGSSPGDGGGSTDPGDGSDSSILSYLGVESAIKNNKASILAYALDQDDYELSDVYISLSCANKLIGTKITNAKGEVKFSYKLKNSSIKCVATATDSDGVITKKKSFKLKAARSRRR